MATKKPSAAQLAARAKFAAAARAGTLRKKSTRKKAAPKKRGANPINSILTYKGFDIHPKKNGWYEWGLKGQRPEQVGKSLAKIKKEIDFLIYDKRVKPNPIHPRAKSNTRKVVHFNYLVQTSNASAGPWRVVAGFTVGDDATDYAHALHKVVPGVHIRVVDN